MWLFRWFRGGVTGRWRSVGLNVLVNSQNAIFSPADLNGTWEAVIDGDTPGSNGLGSIKFNGAGGITGGAITTGTAAFNILGSYVLNADGTITGRASSSRNWGARSR